MERGARVKRRGSVAGWREWRGREAKKKGGARAPPPPPPRGVCAVVPLKTPSLITHTPLSPVPPPHTDFGPGGAASVAYPAGNLRALTTFASGLKSAATAKDIAGLADAVDGLVDGLCTPEALSPSRPVRARCAFPEVELRLVPGECQFTASTGELACRPPFVTLERRPASCALPYLSPATWAGKSCAPTARVGPAINYALGYAPYNISVDPAFAAPLADALTGPLREAGSAIEGKLGGLAKLVPGFLGGGGGGGGSATSSVAVGGK